MRQLPLDLAALDGSTLAHPQYVPVLLDRAGERRALGHCDELTWASMRPIVEVARYGGAPTPGTLKNRAKEIQKCVGSHPFYVDLNGIAPCRWVDTPGGKRETLDLLHDELERRGLSFIPIARPTDPARRLSIVGNAVREHQLGFGLRYRLSSRLQRTGEKASDRLLRTIEAMGSDPKEADLILDLEWIDPDSRPSARWVARQIQELSARARWRAIVLAGTCVPLSMSDIADLDEVGSIARAEWLLWKEVVAATDVDLVFGDYGVQHPKVPTKNGRTFGNLRYTRADEFCVSRGRLITNMDSGDFAAMCRRIAGATSFSGRDFSWGDGQIYRLAQIQRASQVAIFDDFDADEKTDGIYSHTFWRAVATSHHLKFVTTQLAERRANVR